MTKVVVVDDDKTILYLFNHFLKKKFGEHSVASFLNPEDALEFLMTEKVDILLTDYNMPMHGTVFLSHVNKLVDTLPRYVIAVSGEAKTDVFQWSLMNGCFDYYLKPVDGPALMEILGKLASEIPPVKKPSLYINLGTKLVGKSESGVYLARYLATDWFAKRNKTFQVVNKLTTRDEKPRDREAKDTVHVSGFSDLEKKTNVYWQSYHNECLVKTDEIDAVLNSGSDCCVSCGQFDGAKSFLQKYPDAQIFFMAMTEDLLREVYYLRGERDVHFQEILFNQKTMVNKLLADKDMLQNVILVENKTYFDAAKFMHQYVIDKRLGKNLFYNTKERLEIFLRNLDSDTALNSFYY